MKHNNNIQLGMHIHFLDSLLLPQHTLYKQLNTAQWKPLTETKANVKKLTTRFSQVLTTL